MLFVLGVDCLFGVEDLVSLCCSMCMVLLYYFGGCGLKFWEMFDDLLCWC